MVFNIQCDPGALGMQQCYVVMPDGSRQEVIDYDNSGNPITKAPTNNPGMAWVPQLHTLDMQGNMIQPFGPAGIPYTMGGMVGWPGKGGQIGNNPQDTADPQAWQYLNSLPGAFSRWMYQNRECDPLWPTLGCKTSDPASSNTVTTAPDEDESLWSKWFGAEDGGTETNLLKAGGMLAAGALGMGLIMKSREASN